VETVNNRQDDRKNNESKTKIVIRYKRMIIQLVVIISGFILAAVAFFGFNDTQKDLKVNTISIAVGIIAGAFISLMDFLFTKKEKEDEINEAVGDLRDLKGKLESIAYGTKGVTLHKDRNSLNLTKKIKESRQKICIYVTNLDFLTNNFFDLIEAAQKGVSIKILGMKPTNLFIATRYHELGKKNAQSFFDEIRIHLTALRERLAPSTTDPLLIADRFQVKLYVNQPTHMIFWFDDSLVISFILRQGRAREQIHVEFDLNDLNISKMAGDFIKDFKLVWEEANMLTPEVMDQLGFTYDLNHMEAQGIENKINTYSLNTDETRNRDQE